MDIKNFIEQYRHAFGSYELPLGIWYTDAPVAEPQKSKGCFIKDLKAARNGEFVSFNLETIFCPGGKVYTGYMEMPQFLPGFVSGKEKYKETPEMVENFVKELNMSDKSTKYLNFVSIDKLESFESLEGLVFFANPDVMTGLISWVHYDTNKSDAVSVPFASGCSAIVAQTVVENRENGHRTFLGLFDPSVRPQVAADELSLSVPMSRFAEMYHTFGKSCLQGTHAWNNVKKRIENNGN